MDRFLRHVCCWLVVLLGLVALPASNVSANTHRSFPDQGEAFAACAAVMAQALAWRNADGTLRVTSMFRACTQVSPTTAMLQCQTVVGRVSDGVVIAAGNMCTVPTSAGGDNFSWPIAASCATRPRISPGLVAPGQNYACHQGCLYGQGANYGVGFGGRTIFLNWFLSPVGSTCSVGPGQQLPRLPDGDDDNDGISNGRDENPNSPPPPNPNDPPPPQQPETPDENDRRDDGQQIGRELGPKLDEIEQAVLGLAPRIDAVRQAVDQARAQAASAQADANVDADRLVSAIDRVAAAVNAQGPNTGDGNEPVDLSPLAPGGDGGALPDVSSITERVSASDLFAQVDQGGFGFSRSCPAHSWPQDFDLGWGAINIGQMVGIFCYALGILGFFIGLAGLIQASFIVSRIGVPN